MTKLVWLLWLSCGSYGGQRTLLRFSAAYGSRWEPLGATGSRLWHGNNLLKHSPWAGAAWRASQLHPSACRLFNVS